MKDRVRNGNLLGFLPFIDNERKKISCVCFECWRKHKGLTKEKMLAIGCWKGLEEINNPSHRKGQV